MIDGRPRLEKNLLQRGNKSRRFPVSFFRSRFGLKGDLRIVRIRSREQPQSVRRQ